MANYISRYLSLIFPLLFSVGVIFTQNSNHQIITLYLREYPNFKAIPEKVTQKIVDYYKQQNKKLIPGELAELEQRIMLKKCTPPPSNLDLFVMLDGFISHADADCKITLPRKIQNDTLKLVITPSIIPVFSANHNVAYWNLDPNQPAQAFTITKKLDPLTEQLYWEVSEAPLPPNQALSKNTLIMIGDPDTIYIPTDLTPTTDSTQLVLPNIYIKNSSNLTKQNLIESTINNLLNTLHIRPFYAPIKKTYKRTPYGIASQTLT